MLAFDRIDYFLLCKPAKLVDPRVSRQFFRIWLFFVQSQSFFTVILALLFQGSNVVFNFVLEDMSWSGNVANMFYFRTRLKKTSSIVLPLLDFWHFHYVSQFCTVDFKLTEFKYFRELRIWLRIIFFFWIQHKRFFKSFHGTTW